MRALIVQKELLHRRGNVFNVFDANDETRHGPRWIGYVYMTPGGTYTSFDPGEWPGFDTAQQAAEWLFQTDDE